MTPARRVTTPPADRAMSPISSWGLSQESTNWASGPDRYHPSHSSTRSFVIRRGMLLHVSEGLKLLQYGKSCSAFTPTLRKGGSLDPPKEESKNSYLFSLSRFTVGLKPRPSTAGGYRVLRCRTAS
jgi:hypothetical protein